MENTEEFNILPGKNEFLIGKLLYSPMHLEAAKCLIISNLVNGKKVLIDEGVYIIPVF